MQTPIAPVHKETQQKIQGALGERNYNNLVSDNYNTEPKTFGETVHEPLCIYLLKAAPIIYDVEAGGSIPLTRLTLPQHLPSALVT